MDSHNKRTNHTYDPSRPIIAARSGLASILALLVGGLDHKIDRNDPGTLEVEEIEKPVVDQKTVTLAALASDSSAYFTVRELVFGKTLNHLLKNVGTFHASSSVSREQIMRTDLKLLILSFVVVASPASAAFDPNMTNLCSAVRVDRTYWRDCEVRNGRYVTVDGQYNGPIPLRPGPGQTIVAYVADEYVSNPSNGYSSIFTRKVQYVGIINGALPSSASLEGADFSYKVPRSISSLEDIAPPSPPNDADLIDRVVQATISLVDGTRDAILEWVRSGGSRSAFLEAMGERIVTGLSGSISRLGGVINNMLTGLLDPEVQQGVSAIHDAANDSDPNTRGLYMSRDQRQQLQQILDDIDSQKQPIQPSSKSGTTSAFDVQVGAGNPITLDPAFASGFEYKIGSGDPLFKSVALPALGDVQSDFDLHTLVDGAWTYLATVNSLEEYVFATPVSEFRILGINQNAAIDPDAEWVSMVSFTNSGHFTGTITGLQADEISIAEPSQIGIFGIALMLLLGMRVQLKARAE